MPTLHLLAGPNGAGKSSYVLDVLQPVLHLPFVNADVIAAQRWPDAQAEHAYDASRAAETERQRFMAARQSFITETVFSHPSKVDLVDQAITFSYLVHLYVVLLPVDLTVNRVAERARRGGHDVPEQKIRERYERLWRLIATARDRADRTEFFDNSRAAEPFRLISSYDRGRAVGKTKWPVWAPSALTD